MICVYRYIIRIAVNGSLYSKIGEGLRHQKNNTTKYNRYPAIFEKCKEYFELDPPERILSFGCSDGSEAYSLKDLYFPDSKIVGVDFSLQ